MAQGIETLLFTGGGGAASEALHGLLGFRYDVHFADANLDAKPPGIPRNHWHAIPMARLETGLTNTAFVPALSALADRLGADLVIPGVDEELRPIAWSVAHEPRLPSVLLPHFDVVALYLDKLKSMRILGAAGIDVPETRRLRPSKAGIEWPTFPCVMKPREGRGSRGVRIVRNEGEATAHLLLSGIAPEDFIVQEQLVGQEYTVGILADRTEQLKAIVPIRVDDKRGVTLRAVVDDDWAVRALAESVHQALPFSGYINLQCIKDADGRVRPFEINPRISTTTCVAVAAGLDLVGAYFGGEAFPHGQKALTMRRSYQTVFA